MHPAILSLLGMFGGGTPPVLPNRGPFQCGLFQPDVFQNDCAPLSTGAGAGRKRRRPRYCVVIDGKEYEFDNEHEANALLDATLEKAKEAAEQAAQNVANKRAGRRQAMQEVRGLAPALDLHVRAPDTSAIEAQAMRALVDATNAAMVREYRMAMQRARVRAALEQQAQEEEDISVLLMMGIL